MKLVEVKFLIYNYINYNGVLMSEVENFQRYGIFNVAVRAGCSMIRRVDRSTINNMISLFLGREDVDVAINELIMYIARQSGRGEIPRDVAARLLSDIKRIRSICEDHRVLRELLSKYLILIRWAYDSGVGGARNLDELVSRLTR